MKKIAILYSRLSGYSAACQRALKELYGLELLVVHWPIAGEAPFSEEIYGHIDHRYDRSDYDTTGIIQLLDDFQPNALLLSGWMDKAYLKAGRAMKKKGVPVIAGSDTQWTGSWRQQVARRIARFYLHPAIDVLWVTGERQQQLAWRLGYRGARCWSGYYACDWEKFAHAAEKPREKAFLYVGRYVERKGLDVLLEAYRMYRQQAPEPWELWVAGAGPLESTLVGREGVRNLGFLQPHELPELFRRASSFVLPSRYEPWGVVLQEAAASRLPLISSDACGAAVHLLRDGYNGFLFESGNATDLAGCLSALSQTSAVEWTGFSQGSFELSKQYTPRLWAKKLVEKEGHHSPQH